MGACIQVSALADMEGWTFYAYSSTNVTANRTQQFKMYTNLWERIDTVNFRTCFQNPAAFFTGIEINYDLLISPIMLVPRALSTSTLQVKS